MTARNTSNPYEYSFTEVLLAVIAETGRQLREPPCNIELRPGFFLRQMEKLKKTVLSDVELKELGGEAGGGAFKVSAKIGLKARDSDVTRQKLWEALKGDRTTLVEEFARLINQEARPALRKQGYQDLVVIVDWLEKLVDVTGQEGSGAGLHRELFLHHAQLFQSFGAQLVLTLPIDLVYSAAQEQLTMAYGRQPIVINAVRVADSFPKDQHEEGRRALDELLRLRCEKAPEGDVPLGEVFETPELATDVIQFSGGHPRALMILMRQCCSFCDGLPITRAAVEAAKRQETLAAGRKVKEAWYPLLGEVHRTGSIRNDPEHLEMLRTLCVFCYANGEPVYLVDPAILALNKVRHAIAAQKNA